MSSCNLRHLSLERCESLTDIGLSVLSRCRNLETLYVGSTNFDDGSLAALSSECQNLRILDLGLNTMVCVTFLAIGICYHSCQKKTFIVIYCILLFDSFAFRFVAMRLTTSFLTCRFLTAQMLESGGSMNCQMCNRFFLFSVIVGTIHCLQDTSQCVVLLKGLQLYLKNCS